MQGKLICAMGIPGSGKTSVFYQLRILLDEKAVLYSEPEENDLHTPWPKAVSMRQKYGYLGSITWFRSMRVPELMDASEEKDNGKIALVDSYYDKLLFLYLGADGLDWFLPKNDEYYPIIKAMAEKDYSYLPNADIIVFFRVTEEAWTCFCKGRNRNMDREAEFRRQCFALQTAMMDACKKYCIDFHKPLIIYDQTISSPSTAARELQCMLEKLL